LFELLFACCGCRYINPQENLESELAHDLITRMTSYDAISTNTPVTNLHQLFWNPDGHDWYPYKLHQQLIAFGRYAGFKTSVVERYIFFWPRWKHPKLYGDLICMSTTPFRDKDGRLQRVYISYTGKWQNPAPPGNPSTNPAFNVYTKTFIQEDRLQAILREATPSIVHPPPIQPPPPPPPELKPFLDRSFPRQYDEFTRNVADAFSQDRRTVDILLKLAGIVTACALTLFCVFFIRRSRERPPADRHGADTPRSY